MQDAIDRGLQSKKTWGLVLLVVLLAIVTSFAGTSEGDVRLTASIRDKGLLGIRDLSKFKDMPLAPAGSAEPGSPRYIVKLASPSLAEKQGEVERQIKDLKKELAKAEDDAAKESLRARIEELTALKKSVVAAHRATLAADRLAGERAIQARAPKAKIKQTFETAFNGFAIEATPEEAAAIQNAGFTVWPNGIVKAALSDSVPLVGAAAAWSAGYTGAGTTIAVVDTGVDYTHPDLGASPSSDRPFTKITTEPIATAFPLSYRVDQQFDMDGDAVVYLSSGGLNLYSFSTGATEVIPPVQAGHKVHRVVMRGDSIAYFATDQFFQNGALYAYNRGTQTHKKIGAATALSTIDINDGRIVYSRMKDTTSSLKIYAYDIDADQETIVAETGGYIISPVVANDKAYWPNPASLCFAGISVFDFATGETRTVNPPKAGPVLDAVGEEILYVACDPATERWDTYYRYNVTTGVHEEMKFSSAAEGATLGASGFSFYEWISRAELEGNLVYFTKNINEITSIVAYDRVLDRYALLNTTKVAYDFEAEGDRMCMLSMGADIYCHTYNPSDPYIISAPEFNTKVIGGYDFVSNDGDPMDGNGHGTHVAATAAGNGALKGVAPDAKILAYRVLDDSGSGFWSDVIAGINRALDPNQDGDLSDAADVINLSLGGSGNPSDPMAQAVDAAVAAGSVVVVAAGNNGPATSSIGTPGSAKDAITVAATGKDKLIALFSSRGPVLWNNLSLMKPDIAAPGVAICAAATAGYAPNCGPQHVALSGTSMATPHVAGAAALLIGAHPDWSPAQVKAALRGSASVLAQNEISQGSGFLDILAVLGGAVWPAVEIQPLENTRTASLRADFDVEGLVEWRVSSTPASGFTGSRTWKQLAQGTALPADGVFLKLEPKLFPDTRPYILRLEVQSAAGTIGEDFAYVASVEGPDLAIESLQVFSKKGDFFYEVWVANRGSVASPSTVIEIREGSLSPKRVNLSKLEPGQMKRLTGKVRQLPLTVRIDPDNKVAEQNEDNNTAIWESGVAGTRDPAFDLVPEEAGP